jgi:hypothetical protein
MADPYAGLSEDKLPVGPQVIVRKLDRGRVGALIGKCSMRRLITVEETPHGLIVRGRIHEACVETLQAIADEDAAAQAED